MHNIFILYIVVVIAVVGHVENVGKLNYPHKQEKFYSFLHVDKLLESFGNFCGFQQPCFLGTFPYFFNKFLLENFAVENSVRQVCKVAQTVVNLHLKVFHTIFNTCGKCRETSFFSYLVHKLVYFNFKY